MVMDSTRSGGGVGLRGNGVQLLGYRGFLMVALLCVTATLFVIEDAHCSITSDAVAPAPTPLTQQTQPIVTFHQYEADALNAVFQKWSKQNPQLSTLLNWSLEQHPCDNLTAAFDDSTGYTDFHGAWSGVRCTLVLQNLTEIPKHYQISVTGLEILGSNYSCGSGLDINQCGFDGIIGHLPSEISNLTNLQFLWIRNNPKLTGPVPVEIFQLPNLTSMYLINNSLDGTLPSDVYNVDCKLEHLELSHNNFSGNLRVSPQGTLFSSSLEFLNVRFNQLDGPINLQDWIGNRSAVLYLNNNHFGGTFSTGPYSDVQWLDLSCNDFTSIQFTNYIGPIQSNGLDTIYMPSLFSLNISNNKFSGPFLEELYHLPSLFQLDLSMNHFWGSIDFESLNETIRLNHLNISNNNFNGTFFMDAYLYLQTMDLSNNRFNDIKFHVYNETTTSNGNIFLPSLKKIYFQNNNLSGQFPSQILTAPNLQILDASQNECRTLELPILQLNSSLLQVFITNNKLDVVQYPKNGRLSTYNLQFSSILFLGGNPICDKIKNTILSSICRLN